MKLIYKDIKRKPPQQSFVMTLEQEVMAKELLKAGVNLSAMFRSCIEDTYKLLKKEQEKV